MMDLGCYCISALRNLGGEELSCTAATADIWASSSSSSLTHLLARPPC